MFKLVPTYIFLILFFSGANWVNGQAVDTSITSSNTQQPVISHADEMPILFKDNFENGASKWKIIDDQSWKLEDHGAGRSLSIIQRNSEYEPKVRSPRHIALIKNLEAANFVIKFKVKSTKDTGNHRDCCVFFGYQNPTNYYYVHLGAKPDPHSGQIMIVKDAPRLALTINE